MALSAPEDLKGLRDRAVLLLARFAGPSSWRSTVADLDETGDGFKFAPRNVLGRPSSARSEGVRPPSQRRDRQRISLP
jgi:hypothetical protein